MMRALLLTSIPLFNSKEAKPESGSRQTTVLFLGLDFIVLTVSFLLVNYLKRHTFHLDDRYLVLYWLLAATWLLISLVTRKHHLYKYDSLKSAFVHFGKAAVFIVYLLSIFLILLGIYGYSRLQLFGSVAAFFGLEMLVFSGIFIYAGIRGRKSGMVTPVQSIQFRDFSVLLFIADMALITAAFYLMNYFKRNTFVLDANYEDLIFLIYALWLGTAIFTRKFIRYNYRNFYYAVTPYIKAAILMAAIMSVIVYAFQMFYVSRLQIFGGFILFLVLELLFYAVYYYSGFEKRIIKDIETAAEVKDAFQHEELPFELEKIREARQRRIVPVTEKMKNWYLRNHPLLFEHLQASLDLEQIDESDAVVLNTHTMYNIDVLENHSKSLFVNLHPVNDFRHLNRYFLEVHKKIYNGGYLVGCVNTINTHRNRFFQKYSNLIANILYPFDFMIHRVIPKLPFFGKIYFFITRGKNRVISKSETFGRLYFCGFKIVGEKVIDDCLYFIARRVKNPSVEKSPSYGPTIKLKRIGLDGKPMYIYKFRTMHPYSEFLQEYVYWQNRLDENGKFRDDFRLTEWGRVFRKLWIDELPQLVNFWRGDIGLVGVRALSEHYFGLYPKELQELRTRFKPGLVPPYYADMPESFEDILESERRYLMAKEQHPVMTDFKYFFLAWYNIIFKRARSH